jgi:citrate lyase subunit beta / citryl-CoA lyase
MSEWDNRPLRALLFAPGNDRRKLAQVGTFEADAVVIDLEDAVADTEKSAARATARHAIPTYGSDQLVMVRVNGIRSGRLGDDIAAVVCPQLAAVMVPKVEKSETLRVAELALIEAERDSGMKVGAVRLIALVETALGIMRADEITQNAPARTLTTVFGLADFSAELGVELTTSGDELLYARGRLVVATRAAGMISPIDGPYLRLNDEDGLIQDCHRSRALGFQGRVTIHPPQVMPTQRAYSELSEEAAAAQRRIVEAFERARASGVAAVQVDGSFVDYPVYQLARRRLAGYEALFRSGAYSSGRRSPNR